MADSLTGSIKLQCGAGETKTITADAFSNGAAYRLPDTPTPGEQGASRIAIAASSSLTIGGQAVPSRWQIDTLAGVLSLTNTPPPPAVPEIGAVPTSVIRLFGNGAPTGTTGLGIAGPCSEYFDIQNVQMYLNGGTAASPVWKQITRAA
jgi:hypothetical protein